MGRARARTEGIVVKRVEGETLVYDLERHAAHCLSGVADAVWRASDGRATAGEIAERVRAQTGGEAREDVVLVALERLAAAHLLEEESHAREEGTRRAADGPQAVEDAEPGGATGRRATRRAAVARLGAVGAAALLPLVTTIVAPRAAAAASDVVAVGCVTPPGGCCLNGCDLGCACDTSTDADGACVDQNDPFTPCGP